jgi:hypothetical protein
MTEHIEPGPTWVPRFLKLLGETGVVAEAARQAQIATSTAHYRKRTNAAFADDWAAALQQARGDAPAAPTPAAIASIPTPHWRKTFIEALAETSNVTASAERANVPTRTVYKLRREDRDFASKWQAALAEGYDNLEMEVVGYLRDPAPTRKMDVTAALRLLAAHRDTVERRRALTAEEDEKATLESLDAFFEGLKQRRLANEKALREAGNDNDADDRDQ